MYAPAHLERRFTPFPLWFSERNFWATVGYCVLWGPLVGGLPFNWTLFLIPFSYFWGGVPALLSGLLYSTWRHMPARRPPALLERLVMGALCASIGTFAFLYAIAGESFSVWGFEWMIIGCGIFGGTCVAGGMDTRWRDITARARRITRSKHR